MSNHPVHLVNRKNEISPSALIPFCDFGGNMSSMGVIIDKFDIPVCTSFEAKILNDQLCYEVNLNKFSDKDNIKKELKLGLNFVMDYNEDRQIKYHHSVIDNDSFVSKIIESDESQQAFIYLNTIGNLCMHLYHTSIRQVLVPHY